MGAGGTGAGREAGSGYKNRRQGGQGLGALGEALSAAGPGETATPAETVAAPAAPAGAQEPQKAAEGPAGPEGEGTGGALAGGVEGLGKAFGPVGEAVGAALGSVIRFSAAAKKETLRKQSQLIGASTAVQRGLMAQTTKTAQLMSSLKPLG